MVIPSNCSLGLLAAEPLQQFNVDFKDAEGPPTTFPTTESQSQEGDSVCQNREIKEEEAQVLRQRCEDVVRGSWLGVSHFDKERP